jgi:hypothetical protein
MPCPYKQNARTESTSFSAPNTEHLVLHRTNSDEYLSVTPAKACPGLDPGPGSSSLARSWIPASAGMTAEFYPPNLLRQSASTSKSSD